MSALPQGTADTGETNSDATTLLRAAAVVRHRRHIGDGGDLDTQRVERADGGFTARTGALDADFEVLKPGRFVLCAVTRKRIALEDLRYWNVDTQEAYFDAETALKRWKQLAGKE